MGRVSGLNLLSLAGCLALGGLAWLAGGCRRPVAWRTVTGSGLLMLALGLIVFWLPPVRTAFVWLNGAVLALLEAGGAGGVYLLGPLALAPGESTATGEPSVGFVLAARVLPAVIFFASLMALLYHLRLVQPVVLLFARLFRRTLGLSGAESLAGGSNIFFGIESAVTVRPYLERMTRSELLTLLTCAMSTVASTTLAIYVLFLHAAFPQIAGHLISASVLSIPAAALVSKLILPETARPETLGSVPPLDESARHGNGMAALAAGAWDGLRLAAGIATLLIAVLGVVALADLALGRLSAPFAETLGGPLDLARLLGWLFTPLAWLLGIESADLGHAGRLLGARVVLTEVVAYQRLGELARAGAVSPRTMLILSYALCGFTHVASLGIFVGGVAGLAPSRRDDLAALGLRALAGATLATLITGALAGAFYYGQPGVLGL
jgi:CNT family concentrative nucleoside transporter